MPVTDKISNIQSPLIIADSIPRADKHLRCVLVFARHIFTNYVTFAGGAVITVTEQQYIWNGEGGVQFRSND